MFGAERDLRDDLIDTQNRTIALLCAELEALRSGTSQTSCSDFRSPASCGELSVEGKLEEIEEKMRRLSSSLGSSVQKSLDQPIANIAVPFINETESLRESFNAKIEIINDSFNEKIKTVVANVIETTGDQIKDASRLVAMQTTALDSGRQV